MANGRSNGRKQDGKKNPGYVRLDRSLIDSHAWHALSGTDIKLYVAIARSYNGGNNGDLEATLSKMRHQGFKSSATLAKSLRVLQAVGLIAKTRNTGGLTHGGLVCCLYRLTSELVRNNLGNKGIGATTATNDFSRFRSLAEAHAAIKEAHQAAKRPDHPNAQPRKRKDKLRKPNCFTSDFEQVQFNRRTVPSPLGSQTELKEARPDGQQSRANACDQANVEMTDTTHSNSSNSEHLYRLPGGSAETVAETVRAAPASVTDCGLAIPVFTTMKAATAARPVPRAQPGCNLRASS